MSLLLNLGDLPLSRVAEYLDLPSLYAFGASCRATNRLFDAEIDIRDKQTEGKSKAMTAGDRLVRFHTCQTYTDWLERSENHPPSGYPELKLAYDSITEDSYNVHQKSEYFVRFVNLHEDALLWEGFVPVYQHSPLCDMVSEGLLHEETPNELTDFTIYCHLMSESTFELDVRAIDCIHDLLLYPRAETTELPLFGLSIVRLEQDGTMQPIVTTALYAKDSQRHRRIDSPTNTCVFFRDRLLSTDTDLYTTSFLFGTRDTIESLSVVSFDLFDFLRKENYFGDAIHTEEAIVDDAAV